MLKRAYDLAEELAELVEETGAGGQEGVAETP